MTHPTEALNTMQATQKSVYVKFLEPETYRENGRHIFAVLNAFLLAGYQVYLDGEVRRRLEDIFGPAIADWPPPARLAITLPGLNVVNTPPPGAENGIYVFDKEAAELKHRPWRQRLHVGFDLFSPYRFSKPLLLPYNVHPMHARKVVGDSLRVLRDTRRRVRILFAGDLTGYKRRWIRYPKEKLSRTEVIAALKERLGDRLRIAKTPQELREVMEGEYLRQMVIVDNDGARVPWEQWMEVIARADFFLCPPGIVMPMCHNIIEAMAIGTIPITNYPEWFSPNLEHMKNCVVFDDADDLIRKIDLALAMSDEQKEALRRNAMQFHDQHLRPETFVAKVEARNERRLNVLLYSEYNVAKKTARLNARSVLMRGEDAVGDWAWLTRVWQP